MQLRGDCSKPQEGSRRQQACIRPGHGIPPHGEGCRLRARKTCTSAQKCKPACTQGGNKPHIHLSAEHIPRSEGSINPFRVGGVADPLTRLAQLRALLPAETVLFGNGDILSLSHAQRMASETGCDGIAAGRVLLSNPFLLSKIAQNSDAAATEEEKLYFLRVLLESAVASGQCRKKWLQHSFIEYVKMCFGKETSVFRSAVADPEKFVLEILKI